MIEFSTEMGQLRKHINFVRNGLGAAKTDLTVQILRFNVTGNKAVIFAANREMFCRTDMKITRHEGDDVEDGSFSVLGAKIERLISQVETEQVSFKADNENLEINAGFLTVNFELYDGATLKTIEQGVQSHLDIEGLGVSRSALEEALTCARSCTTTNSIRPDVTHAELRAGRMLSSDGRKIMIYSHDAFPKEMGLKVPATVLSSVATAVKNIDAENLSVAEGDSYYYIKGGLNTFTMGVRKVERTFPQVESQVANSSEPTDEISVDKNVLEAMLRGVALGLASDDVKVSLDTAGKGSEAYLEISATNGASRRSHERASCGRKSELDLSFPVSFKHLLDTLSVFKGDSVVDMLVMQKLNLMMVRDHTEAREVLTIIPFRTDKQIELEQKEKLAAAEAAKKAKEEETPKPHENIDAGDIADSAATADDLELDVA